MGLRRPSPQTMHNSVSTVRALQTATGFFYKDRIGYDDNPPQGLSETRRGSAVFAYSR
jgi:hypothetical protein